MIAIKELARQFLDGYYHYKMSDFTTKTMSWQLYQNGFDEFYYYFFDRRWAVLLYIGSRLYVMIMIFFFQVRELDGIALILDNCNIDSNNPCILRLTCRLYHEELERI